MLARQCVVWPARGSSSVIAAAMLLMAACRDDDSNAVGGSSPDTTAGDDAGSARDPLRKVGVVFDVGTPAAERVNESVAEGLERATTRLPVEVRDLTPTADGANREELLRLLAQSGVELVVAVGAAARDAVATVAGEFPDVRFVFVGDVVDAPNVTSLTFATNEAAYLLGAAAALTSAGDRIGFLGADDAGSRRVEAGYVAGARKIDPGIVVDVQYVVDVAIDVGTMAGSMYAAGADVVLHAAGGDSRVVLEAARDASGDGAKKWVIGVGVDHHETADGAARDHALTSLLTYVDVGLYDVSTASSTATSRAGTPNARSRTAASATRRAAGSSPRSRASSTNWNGRSSPATSTYRRAGRSAC